MEKELSLHLFLVFSLIAQFFHQSPFLNKVDVKSDVNDPISKRAPKNSAIFALNNEIHDSTSLFNAGPDEVVAHQNNCFSKNTR